MKRLNDIFNVAIIAAVGVFVLTLAIEGMPVLLAFLLAFAAQAIVAALLVGLDRAVGIR